MSPPPVTSHIPQPPNILPHLPLRIILNRHVRQLRRQLRDGTLWDFADTRLWVDTELREEAGGGLWAKSVEGLQGCGHQFGFREVDAEEENLVVVSCAVLYCFPGGYRGRIGVLGEEIALWGFGARKKYTIMRDVEGVEFARLRLLGIGTGDNRRRSLCCTVVRILETLKKHFGFRGFAAQTTQITALHITCSPYPCRNCQSNTYVKPGQPMGSELKGVFGVVFPATSFPIQQQPQHF
ncbi:hypothetical protein V491_07397 [Pseudogymnoascus sp. VKM F-3775]|nr:hypothetical protein V491_07397 [Pseudogymnoascus sp. VKM F-3775]